MSSDTTSGQRDIWVEIGTRLLFENDRVRVWDLQLAPGESTGVHRHTNDYLYVVIGDGMLQTVFADGRRNAARAMATATCDFARSRTRTSTRRSTWAIGRGGTSWWS